MPRKHDTKGRSKTGGRFIALPHFMLETPAWRTLPVYERAAYLEVAQLYDGANNGYLAMSVRRLAKRMGVSVNKASWCLQTLVDRGFLEVAEQSWFARSEQARAAASFRLTHLRCDRTQQAGSRAYQAWRPEPEEMKSTVAPRDRSVSPGATVVALASHGARR